LNISISYWRKISTNINNIWINRSWWTADSTTQSCILCWCWLLNKNIGWNCWKNCIIKIINNNFSSKNNKNLIKKNKKSNERIRLTDYKIHIVVMLKQLNVFDYLIKYVLLIFYKLLNKLLMVNLQLNVDMIMVQMNNEVIEQLLKDLLLFHIVLKLMDQ